MNTPTFNERDDRVVHSLTLTGSRTEGGKSKLTTGTSFERISSRPCPPYLRLPLLQIEAQKLSWPSSDP